MCQMSIVLKQGAGEEVILRNAALLESTDKGIVVSALFEDPRLVEGAVVSRIDFMQGLVTLKKEAGRSADCVVRTAPARG